MPWLPPAGGVAEATTCSIAVAGAGAAVVAGRPPAVGQAELGEGVPPVLPQEVPVQAGREVVPRAAPRPRCGGGGRTSRCRGRGRPWPRSTGRGGSARPTPGTRRRRRHTVSMTAPMRRSPRLAMPSAIDARGSCHLRLTPLGLVALPARSSRSSPILRRSSTSVFWPNHWNGVCGLGTNPPTDTVTDAPLLWLRPMRDDVAGELGDAEGVLVGLGGQAGEEVELHPPPALRVGRLDRRVEVLLGDQLVDHLAHPPRAGLGREGEAAAAGPLELGGDADGEGVDPQARQVAPT